MYNIVEYDDLFQEGYLSYQVALKEFDSCKARFTTFLTKVVTNRYINLCKQCYKFEDSDKYERLEVDYLTICPSFIWELLAFDYSHRAQKLIDLITNCSARATAEPTLKALYRHLQEVGYTDTKALEEVIVKAHRDLKGQRVVLLKHWDSFNQFTLFTMKGVNYGTHDH